MAAFAAACGNSDQHVTYIGIVDATPPRLGRTENSVSPGDAAGTVDQDGDGGTSSKKDAGDAAGEASGGDGAAASDVDTAADAGPE